VVHLPGYSACPVPTSVGTKGTCDAVDLPESPLRILADARRSGVAKDLKTGWFPAPSLSRIFPEEDASNQVAHGLVQKAFNFLGPCAVPGQMASHHFDQIYEFTT
jgi:hypothetical protein